MASEGAGVPGADAGGNEHAQSSSEAAGNGDARRREGLLVDWGGVLTTNLFSSFQAYCVQVQIDPATLRERFSADPHCRELLISLEKGQLEERDFECRLAALLEVSSEGLIDGLFAGVQADTAMLDAVRQARLAGVRTALVSNSWGVHRYPHELFDELFDGVVISAQEGTRKPSRRMYELGAERAGVPAELCVFVDDLPFNLPPAERLGMATVHHTSSQTTIPELERLLGVALGAGEVDATAGP
jgi:putative hydrolase of the HAD superfamily